jgi:hypothetical protein
MNWLQKLLLIEAPENTSLQAAKFDLRGVIPWWVAALILAICAAGVLFLYFQERGRFGVVRRVLLVTLRTAVIALVLLLLLRPVLLAEFKGDRPRNVVLLIDDSQSMQQQDRRISDQDRLRVALAKGLVPPDTTATDLGSLPAEQLKDTERVQLVKAVLANSNLKLLDGLKGRGPLQVFLFGAKLRSPEDTAGEKSLGDSLRANDSQTALADVIHELLERSGGDPPAAVVVLTDGRDNASKLTLDEAAQECKDKGVPLHVWGVGSSEGGLLQLREVSVPNTLFVDEKPDVADDPVDVIVRWRCRGLKQGTVVLKITLGDQVVAREVDLKPGEDLREVIKLTPRKGKEGKRDFAVTLELKGQEAIYHDEFKREVQVKHNKVKVLYVEELPRREYKFLQPILDRDRRVLARYFLVEGDPKMTYKPDKESSSLFLDAFPENFPDASPRDPDQRRYDLLILGDVAPAALGKQGLQAVERFVKEGGGLVVIAGRLHTPAEYVDSPLAEAFPVKFARHQFKVNPDARTEPFKPVLTYEGEQSHVLALADEQDKNLRLWKDDLWKDAGGFFWHYPVNGLRAGATALLVHPDEKTADKPEPKPMPLIASMYYGKGEVLFFGIDETWRWRHNTGDRLTARFWAQVVSRLGLPHLLEDSSRIKLELERSEALLGRPGSVKARLLDNAYKPLEVRSVPATLHYLDAKEGEQKTRPIELRAVTGLPGEYRGTLPNDAPGRFELRVDKGVSLEAASLSYQVELQPRHELEVAGMAEEPLRSLAKTSGGRFYREEDLHQLAGAIESRKTEFILRQEILLWNPLTLVVFVGLITAEWVVRKFSNLS